MHRNNHYGTETYCNNNFHKNKVKCSLFIMLNVGPYIGTDHVISELCYKGTIFQRNYRKMDHFMVNLKDCMVKYFGSHHRLIMRCVIKGMCCNFSHNNHFTH